MLALVAEQTTGTSIEDLLHCFMLMPFANRTPAVACLEVGVIQKYMIYNGSILM